jgi:hypothetical protein
MKRLQILLSAFFLLFLSACSSDKDSCKAAGEVEIHMEQLYTQTDVSLNYTNMGAGYNQRSGFMRAYNYESGQSARVDMDAQDTDQFLDTLPDFNLSDRSGNLFLVSKIDEASTLLTKENLSVTSDLDAPGLDQTYRLNEDLSPLKQAFNDSISLEGTEICSSSIGAYVLRSSTSDQQISIVISYKAGVKAK